MSFSVVHNRIRLTRGDSAEIALKITQPDREVFVLEDGGEITFTLKKNLTDEEPVLVKSLGKGIIHDGEKYRIVFHPGDTRNLPCGRYVFDVELERESGYTDTIIPTSSFFLEREVTDHGP